MLMALLDTHSSAQGNLRRVYLSYDHMQAMKKVEAKNALENYAYQLRNTIRDEKVRSTRLTCCHQHRMCTA